jgi:hypothetical protein
MPARTRLVLAALALLLVLALASCGGSSTTVEHTVTVMKTRKAPPPTYLTDVVSTRRYVKPRTYVFSADGDLVMKNLKWQAWGSDSATATGKIEERPASGLVDTFTGSMRAGKPETCKGARYYTEVFAQVPPQAPFVPAEPTPLATPCSG